MHTAAHFNRNRQLSCRHVMDLRFHASSYTAEKLVLRTVTFANVKCETNDDKWAFSCSAPLMSSVCAIGHQRSLAGFNYPDAIILYAFKTHGESALSMKAKKKTKLIKMKFVPELT